MPSCQIILDGVINPFSGDMTIAKDSILVIDRVKSSNPFKISYLLLKREDQLICASFFYFALQINPFLLSMLEDRCFLLNQSHLYVEFCINKMRFYYLKRLTISFYLLYMSISAVFETLMQCRRNNPIFVSPRLA